MTVQISVTVWTILCFIALMLILDRLLFRPMLGIMDKRREKIDGARAARQRALRERETELSRREEERLAAKKRATQDASDALEAQRGENARRLAEKKAENERRLARQQEELRAESQAILTELEPRTEALAAAFSEKLRRWTYQEDGRTETADVAAPYVEEPAASASKTDE